MSATKNPAAALEALTHPATTPVGRFEVQELTLGMQALLQRIGSPVSDRNAPRTLEAWAETLYAVTRPASETRRSIARGREAFREEALAWADTVSNEEGIALMRAVDEAVGRLNATNLVPDNEDEAPEDLEAPADTDPTADGPTAGSPGA